MAEVGPAVVHVQHRHVDQPGSAAGTSPGRSTRTYSKVPQGALAGQSVTQNWRPCLCLKAHSRGMIPES